jgi:hypothetical protein
MKKKIKKNKKEKIKKILNKLYSENDQLLDYVPLRIFPDIGYAINLIIKDEESPYKTKSDFIRAAIIQKLRKEVEE